MATTTPAKLTSMKNITSPNDPWDLSFVDTAWDLSGISPSAGVVSSENTGLEPEGADTSDSWLDTFSQLESSLLASATGHKKADTITMTSQPLARKTTAAANRKVKKETALDVGIVACPGFGFGSAKATVGDGNCGVANGSGDMGQGMNMDKRRCRQLHRESFIAAIAKHRAAASLVPLGSPLSNSPPPSPKRHAKHLVSGWVRKRPLLAHETASGEYDAITVDDKDPMTTTLTKGMSSQVTTHACLMKPDLRRMFLRNGTFTPSGGVFNEGSTSSDLYEAAGKPLVELALRGGRGTLLFYGQTGSGKTMTTHEVQRLIAADLFAKGALAVEVTAVEVAGKRVSDLGHRKEVMVLQTASGGAELRGVQPFVAGSASELSAHIDDVLKARRTHATGVNQTSSRSHALIHLTVGTLTSDTGRVTLLDCAGSEWALDSSKHTAQRQREGAEINASLHALKNCVRALSQRQKRDERIRVPYREALLTRLLRECFEDAGGSGSAIKLAIVGCVSPGAADTEHSNSTLRTVMELAGEQYECVTTTTDVPRIKKREDAVELS